MKRIWNLALGTAVLCTVLLCGCALSGPTAPDSAAPTDPLTGQELQYPGERTAAVVIDNAASSTTQWGIGSASVVLEALTESGSCTELCLVYPALSALPVVGPAHQPVLGLSFGIGHANRRSSDPGAGPLLAAAQRAGSTAHPAGCRAVCPQLSGLL